MPTEVSVVAVKLSSPVVGTDPAARRLKMWAVALVALTTVFFVGAILLEEVGLPPLTLWGRAVFGVVATPLVVAFHLSWVAWRREHKVADLLPRSGEVIAAAVTYPERQPQQGSETREGLVAPCADRL